MSVCKINECGFESIVLFDWTKLNTSVKNSTLSHPPRKNVGEINPLITDESM